MKRKIISIITALFSAILITSTVFAGAIKFTSVSFSLGTAGGFGGLAKVASLVAIEPSSPPPLLANGTLIGLGNQDVTVKLEASGFPEVTCTNPGENQAPGLNPPKVSANGEQKLLFGLDFTGKNGKSPFGVMTNDPGAVDAIEYGCPNANWVATINFIYWTNATISVYDAATNTLLRSQDYTCTTTLNSVTCEPVN